MMEINKIKIIVELKKIKINLLHGKILLVLLDIKGIKIFIYYLFNIIKILSIVIHIQLIIN
jgi:hypothetical protein